MKAKEREEARRLRLEEGLSVGDISRKVGVSKGTVSLWVRTVELTEDQKTRLAERSKSGEWQMMGSSGGKDRGRERREKWQILGRDMVGIDTEDDLKLLCALYWAEGNKDRYTVGMTNTDADMLKFFVSGLRKYFGCKDEDFTLRVMAHLNNGLTVDQIQDYWLKELGLPVECIRRFILKSKYYSEQNKKHNRHVYGGCSVRVNSVEIIQKLYGAIQETFGIDRPDWLWG